MTVSNRFSRPSSLVASATSKLTDTPARSALALARSIAAGELSIPVVAYPLAA